MSRRPLTDAERAHGTSLELKRLDTMEVEIATLASRLKSLRAERNSLYHRIYERAVYAGMSAVQKAAKIAKTNVYRRRRHAA